MTTSQFFRRSVIFPQTFIKRIYLGQDVFTRHQFHNSRFIFTGKSNFQKHDSLFDKAKTIRNYVVAAGVATLGLAYAAVPLYRIFCQASGFGGTAKHDVGGEKVESLRKVYHRPIKVKFVSDVSTNLKWKFEPQQKELVVIPGETALAFYTATNPLDKPIVGISTYNILPYEAAPYFNKIQCFCFEEQQLNPKEQVDMPVFFYIDPEFCEDPSMENVNEIILSYTFFQAKSGMTLSMPSSYSLQSSLQKY